MNDDKKPRRRDLFTTAALTITGIGATLALWPLIAALGPTADDRARRIVFNLSQLNGAEPSLVEVGRRVVIVLRRTPQDLIGLRDPQRIRRPRAGRDTNEPQGTNNWHRSLRPDIAVFNATCTRSDCLVRRLPAADELLCACCGSHYDLAGRVFTGPAPTNLIVPPHEYLGDAEIVFPEYVAA